MSINARRAAVLAASAGLLMLASGPAAAQADQRTAINILVECSKIEDAGARLACYDNNIAQARNSIPSAVPVPPRGAAAGPAASASPEGFGAESVRVRQPSASTPRGVDEIHPVIASARERSPGIYLVTLQDGAEWVFTDSVDISFRPPRAGQTIEIERGALDGYLMRIDGQRSVPVRRVR